jgi:hypothetical protein
MNTVVLRDVIRRRAAAGRGTMPLLCFAHGTELKMYNNEKRGDSRRSSRCASCRSCSARRSSTTPTRTTASTSSRRSRPSRSRRLLACSRSSRASAVVLSPNGYNQDVFRVLTGRATRPRERAAGFSTQPPRAATSPEPVAPPDGLRRGGRVLRQVRRLEAADALLRAAAIYEQQRDAHPHPRHWLWPPRGAT